MANNSFNSSSGMKKVKPSPVFSRFDRCMLRRAIDATIFQMESNPKSYMKAFGIGSKDTVKRTIRSLSKTKVKLGIE